MKLLYLHLQKDSVLREDFDSMHCIVFMLKGSGECESHVDMKYTLYERQMVFCPISTSFCCTFRTDATVMLVNFRDVTDPMSISFVNTLQPVEQPLQPHTKPYILKIHPVLNVFFSFMENISNTHWMQDPPMLQRILGGMFYLFSIIQTPTQNSLFFSPLTRGEYSFKNLVFRHHLQAKNVQELAELCGYTYYTFNRMFLRQFNVSPYKWMTEERKKRILQQLEDPTIPMKSIAATFYFSSAAHLSKFCKTNFGETATNIRKRMLIKTSPAKM